MAKLLDRSAIRKKVVFFAGSAWYWPRSEGASWRHFEAPYTLNFFYLYKTWYGQQLLKTVKYVRSVTKKISTTPELISQLLDMIAQIWKVLRDSDNYL